MSASRGNYIGLKEAPEEQFGKTMRIPDSLLTQWYALVMEARAAEPATRCEAKLELARFIVRALARGGGGARRPRSTSRAWSVRVGAGRGAGGARCRRTIRCTCRRCSSSTSGSARRARRAG